MKLTTIVYSALLATTPIAPFAKPIAEAKAEAFILTGKEPGNFHHFCYRPGEVCSEARRNLDDLSTIHKRIALANAEAFAAAEAKAEALILTGKEPGHFHHFCYRPGEVCTEAKRDTAKAEEAANHNDICNQPSGPCSKLKRAAAAAASAMAISEALPTAANDTAAALAHQHFCHQPNQTCSTARRAALALAEAIPAPSITTAQQAPQYSCYLPNGPCSIAKRNALAAAEAEASAFILTEVEPGSRHHFCYRPGEVCTEAKAKAKAKRDADAQAYCDSPAGPCAAMKRFAAAVAKAIAGPTGAGASTVEAEAGVSEGERAARDSCYAKGGACAINQRAVEDLKGLIREMGA